MPNPTLEDLVTIGQTAALENIQKDRCLLRRNTRLLQNKQFRLGKEDRDRAAEETCEGEDMRVSIDRSVNHYHGHRRSGGAAAGFPRWLLWCSFVLLVLALGWLLWWALYDPIIWQLDIEAVN